MQIGSRVIITVQGAHTAGFLLLRVMDSISFGMLLILTTPWNGILLALRWFRLPSVLIDILGMTYRYIFLLLHTANSMFLARRSRSLGAFSGGENRRWLARTLASTMAKSQHLSEEVYLAMLSRGYQGEIYSLNRLQFRNRDYLWVGVDYGWRPRFYCGASIDERISTRRSVFEARNLSYNYAGNIPALKRINFSIHCRGTGGPGRRQRLR